MQRADAVEGASIDTKGLARVTVAVPLHEMNDCADFPPNGHELALPAELRGLTASTACSKGCPSPSAVSPTSDHLAD